MKPNPGQRKPVISKREANICTVILLVGIAIVVVSIFVGLMRG
jgi:uncharacterized membrane protein YtjA (UPF0391 family)